MTASYDVVLAADGARFLRAPQRPFPSSLASSFRLGLDDGTATQKGRTPQAEWGMTVSQGDRRGT